MDILQSYHYNILKHVATKYVRDFYHKIYWDQRMIAIKGPRGVGKRPYC